MFTTHMIKWVAILQHGQFIPFDIFQMVQFLNSVRLNFVKHNFLCACVLMEWIICRSRKYSHAQRAVKTSLRLITSIFPCFVLSFIISNRLHCISNTDYISNKHGKTSLKWLLSHMNFSVLWQSQEKGT